MKLLNSVIKSLQQDEMLQKSKAFAHALVMRADSKLEMIPCDIKDALKDAYLATEIDDIHGKAWRTIADAEERDGNTIKAIEAVSKWAECNPLFATKATNEISRLSSLP